EPSPQPDAIQPQLPFGERASQADLHEIVGANGISCQNTRVASQPGDFGFEQLHGAIASLRGVQERFFADYSPETARDGRAIVLLCRRCSRKTGVLPAEVIVKSCGLIRRASSHSRI